MADKQLIEGAYKAAKSGSYKSVDISGAFSGLAEVIQVKQKQAEKLQQDLESKTGYQPDITKVGVTFWCFFLKYISDFTCKIS